MRNFTGKASMGDELKNTKVVARAVRNKLAEAIMPLTAICVMAAAAYAYLLFHGWRNGLPMGGPEEWGQFGDYFAGVTNPVLGFFTLWLLLRTLQITRQVRDDTAAMMSDQRNDMGEQLRLLQDDAKRRVDSERIDTHRRILQGILVAWQSEMASGTYNGPVTVKGNAAFPAVQEKAFGALLYDPRMKVSLKSDICPDEKILEQYELMVDNWRNRFAEPIRLIHEMDVHAQRFISADGPEVEAEFYRSRLAPAVGVFHSAGLITQDVARRFSID